MKASLLFLIIMGLAISVLSPVSQFETQMRGAGEARILEDSIAAIQRQLDSTRRKIDQLDRELVDLTQREQNCLEQLELCEQRIQVTVTHLRALDLSIQQHTREIARITLAIDSTNAELLNRKRLLAARVVGIYKYSRLFPISTFVSTRSLSEFYFRIMSLRRIARADRRLLTDISRLRSELAGQQNQLLAARANLEYLISESREREQELLRNRAAQTILLEQIRSTRSANLAVSEELRRSAEGMQCLLAELQDRYSSLHQGSGFANLRGNLSWPVRGRVIARYGSRTHPRYRTKTTNLGIDIQPAAPTTVSAVAAGRVVFSDRFLGYGNLVIVDHGDGYYTLYGNLDELSATVGTTVHPGSPLGIVSDYLHFEIRSQGQPLNPDQWLRNENNNE